MRKRSRLRPIILTSVALALVLWTGYRYVTRPSALRARLVALLEKFDLRVVSIGQISFSPSAGLEVRDLRVAASADLPLARRGRVPNPPPLLRVPRAHVDVSAWALLLGRFQPRAVELDSPTIALIGSPTRASALRESRWADRLEVPPEMPAGLPQLKIKRADFEVFVIKNDRLHLQRRWVVDGSGALTGGGSQPRAYVLRLDQVAGPVSAQHRRGPPLARLRWQAGQVIAELGWVDLELLQAFLPARWAQSAQRLRLSGQARAQRLVLARDGIAAAEVRFDELRFCVPIENDTEEAPDECFAHIADAAGVLSYVAAEPAASAAAPIRHGDLRLDISGRLNGAAAEFSLALLDAGHAAGKDADSGEQADTLGIRGLRAGRYELSLRVAGLTLPTVEENPRFVSSKRLPGAIRSTFRKYNAEGRVNLQLELRGRPADETDGKAITHYRGELEALGISCCYSGFPYHVDDAYGSVRFSDSDGIVLDGLHGRHGAGRLRVDGKVIDSTSAAGFELSFRARNIATDNDLYAALPSEYQGLWENAAPIGLCDVQTTLRRAHSLDEARPLDTVVRVDARLLSSSLMLHDGTRLENASGLIHVADRTVALDDLHGYLDNALVRVNGTLTLAAGDEPPRYDLHVEAADTTLRRTSEVRDGRGRPIGSIHFEGVGDLWGHLSSGEHAQNHYVIHVTDGRLTGFDPSAPWTQAKGWLSLGDEEQRIRALTALRNDGRLEVSGTLPTHLGLDAPIVLDLHADDADLERLLRQLVPGRWSKIRAALGLAGRGRITARFHPQTVEGSRRRQAADVQLEAECMQPTPIPLELRDIKARLTLHATGFDLHEASARHGENGRVAVSGHGGWADGNIWSDIRVTAQELELTSALVQAMPTPLASLLKRMAPHGQMNLTLDEVRLTGSQQRAWNVVGRMQLTDAELNVGTPLTEFDGQLSGSCDIRPDGQVGLEADFTIGQGRLAGRPIERWEGHLRRQPGSSRLLIEDVRGRLCDGEVVGFAVVDAETSTYELSFTLHDVSLDQFLRRKTDGKSTRPTQGRLDGYIFVRGGTEDPAQRGGGELRLRGTSLLSSPVTASLIDASRQQKRSISDKVERAELRFVWEGQEVKFSRVDIHSRDLRLIGMGHWNMRTDAIAMTLLGATPEDAPRLLVLTDLLESAGQELMRYRVEGTAANPRVTIEPLHNLTDPLRKLLKGE